MSGADDKKAKRQKVAVAECDRRTVFVAGLPESVTDKELRLFFAFAPGFIKVQRQSGAQPLAFALFDTQMSALDAITRIQGYAFEEGSAQTLRAELAKGNLHAASDEVAEYAPNPSYSTAVPWPSEMLPPAQPIDLPGSLYSAPRYGAPHTSHHTPYPPPAAYQPPQYQPPPYQPPAYQPPVPYPYPARPSDYQTPYPPPAGVPSGPNATWTPGPEPKGDRQAGGKNPPCDTLVLWGVKSDEATLLPTLQPLGMTNTKWTGKPGQSSAVWVQFGTVEQATAAIGVLHGRDGIRAEYSKNSLNKKG